MAGRSQSPRTHHCASCDSQAHVTAAASARTAWSGSAPPGKAYESMHGKPVRLATADARAAAL